MQAQPYLQQKLIPIVITGLGSKNAQLNEAVKQMFEEELVEISDLGTSMVLNLIDKKIEYTSAESFSIRLNETKEKQFQRIFEAWAFEVANCAESTPDMEVLFVEPDEKGDMVDAWIVRIVGPTYFDGNAAMMNPPTKEMVQADPRYKSSPIGISFAGRITTGYPIMERVMPIYAQFVASRQETSKPVPIKRTTTRRSQAPSTKAAAEPRRRAVKDSITTRIASKTSKKAS